jgi:hypothetical protein
MRNAPTGWHTYFITCPLLIDSPPCAHTHAYAHAYAYVYAAKPSPVPTDLQYVPYFFTSKHSPPPPPSLPLPPLPS